MLFAARLMRSSTGCMACRAMLLPMVHTWLQVRGICSYAASVSAAADSMAFFTTSAVMAPSLAISRICPVETPMYSAMVLAIMGVCSSTLLSSSPRRVPDASAWVSWTMAA